MRASVQLSHMYVTARDQCEIGAAVTQLRKSYRMAGPLTSLSNECVTRIAVCYWRVGWVVINRSQLMKVADQVIRGALSASCTAYGSSSALYCALMLRKPLYVCS